MGWILEHKQGRRLTGLSGIPKVAGQNNALMNYGEKFTEQAKVRHACQSQKLGRCSLQSMLHAVETANRWKCQMER